MPITYRGYILTEGEDGEFEITHNSEPEEFITTAGTEADAVEMINDWMVAV